MPTFAYWTYHVKQYNMSDRDLLRDSRWKNDADRHEGRDIHIAALIVDDMIHGHAGVAN
jgi:hypothetical protein